MQGDLCIEEAAFLDNRSHRLVYLWAYLTIPVQFILIYNGLYGFFIIFIPVYIFLLIPIQALIVGGGACK